MNLPDVISTEEELEDVMSIPSQRLVQFMNGLDGDIMILGIGGKMGTTLGRLAVNACTKAGAKKKIFGVSRFSNPKVQQKLGECGLETIPCDLLERDAVEQLPQVKNIVFMAGKKFGTSGDEEMTWAMNALVPGNVGHHFTDSRIVAFSTGNVYPFAPICSGGCMEDDMTGPIGEYAQSCLARERVFHYYSLRNQSPMAIIRLNYAIDLRYGVLYDIGSRVLNEEAIDLTTGHANVIWQGDANAHTLLALGHCRIPPSIFNVTGPETISVRQVAAQYGQLFETEPIFEGEESESALLSNSSKAVRHFGDPDVSLRQMIEWTACWLKGNGPSLNKPTNFEVRDGKF